MSISVRAEKINTNSNARESVLEEVAMETPVNLFVNSEYVITLLATPELQKELALGWFFDEGVLKSFDEVEDILVNEDRVNVITRHPVEKERLQVVSVSRLLTTACGLSASKFWRVINATGKKLVGSDYKVEATNIIKMIRTLERGKLHQLTRGVHVAALFQEGKLVALAEDIGRHNTIDKIIGIGILSKIKFSNSVVVSSGRQPADMVLKAARMGIPLVVSLAGPIRSGIIAAENTGVTLVCFVKRPQIRIYSHPERIQLNNA
jgi:FdhD protein